MSTSVPRTAWSARLRLPDAEGWDRAARAALLAAGAVFVLVYLGMAFVRARYPFALEWIESGILDSVRRVIEHRPLFAEPRLSYIPFNYTPLYYYVCAPFAHWFGLGFLPLRLVSIASSLGCFGLIYALVRNETRNRTAAALAVAMFAASYELTGVWFDLARADSLSVLLLLAGFACLVLDSARVRGAALAGLFLGLSFLAKQSAIPATLPLAAYLLVRHRARGLALTAVLGLVVAGSTVWFDRSSGGWYSYYVFTVPAGSPIHLSWFAHFWIHDAGRLGFALVVGLAYLVLSRGESVTPRKALFGWWAAGLLLASWTVRLYEGGSENNVMPMAAAAAVLFGLGWAEIDRRLRAAPAPPARAISTLFQIACLMQFVGLGYFPLKYLPRRSDVVAGKAVVEAIREIPGDVLVPFHPYLAEMAGKPAHYHAMAQAAVVQSGRGRAGALLRERYEEAIRTRRFSAILLDASMKRVGDTTPGYVLTDQLFENSGAFWTRSGARARPELVYRPVAP